MSNDAGQTVDLDASDERFKNGAAAYEYATEAFRDVESEIAGALPRGVNFGYDRAGEANRVCDDGACLWVIYASVQDHRSGELWEGVPKQLPYKYQLRVNPHDGHLVIGISLPRTPEWREFKTIESFRIFLRPRLHFEHAGGIGDADAGWRK
jgi:hypothetical protein